MKILFILDYIPYPLNSGGNQAVFNMINSLRELHEISLCTFLRNESEIRGAEGLRSIWPDVEIYTAKNEVKKEEHNSSQIEIPNTFACRFFASVRDSMNRKIERRQIKVAKSNVNTPDLQNYFSENDFVKENSILSYLGDRFTPEYYELVWNVSRKGFDVVQVEFFSSLSLVYLLPDDVIKVYVQHEIGFVRRENELSLFKKQTPEDVLDFQRIKSMELSALSKFDYVIALTEIDKKIMLDENPNLNIYVSPAVVSLPSKILKSDKSIAKKKELVFVGSGSHFPNADGVVWFLSEVMPILKRKGYDIKVNILGVWGDSIRNIVQVAFPNAFFTGFVDDLFTFLNKRITIVPIRIGSGMRMKILDSIVASSPIVTTSKGCEGLPFADKEDYTIADSPEEFADSVIELIDDLDKQETYVKNIQKKMIDFFDFEALKEKRIEFYNLIKNV